MQQLAPLSFQSDDMESQFTKDIFDDIDYNIKLAVGTTDPARMIITVENEKLNTDKPTLNDNEILQSTNPARLAMLPRAVAAAAAAAPDDATATTGIAVVARPSAQRQAMAKQYQYEVIRSFQASLTKKLSADMKAAKDLDMLIGRLATGSIFIIGTCVVACASVSFAFPAFFNLLMTNGFILLPGSDIMFMSLLETVFPFFPSQIAIFKKSFDVLRSLSPEKYNILRRIFMENNLEFVNLKKEDIEKIKDALVAADLVPALKAITDIQGALLLNLVSPDHVTILTSIFNHDTAFDTAIDILDKLPGAFELLRRLNFVFKSTSFMFNFHAASDATSFYQQLISATANTVFNGQYAILKTTDTVLPVLSSLFDFSIRQEIPLLFGNKFVLEFSNMFAANILARLLHNEASKKATAFATDIFKIDTNAQRQKSASNPDGDDKSPIAVRRRELLEEGKRGEEIVKQLSSEFVDYKRLHTTETEPAYDGVEKFMYDMKKFVLGFFGSFVNNDYFNRFAITCLIAAPTFLFMMPANPNDVLTAASSSSTISVSSFTDLWDSLSDIWKEAFWKCAVPFMTAAQLIISNVVVRPYLLHAADKIYKVGTEFMENMWSSISKGFNYMYLMSMGKFVQNNQQFFQLIIIKQFFECAGYFAHFLKSLGKILGYLGGEAVKLQVFNTMRMSSLHIVNYIRTLTIEDFYNLFSSARESLLSYTDQTAYLNLLTDRASAMISTAAMNSGNKNIKILYKRDTPGIIDTIAKGLAAIPVLFTFAIEGSPSNWGRVGVSGNRSAIVRSDNVDIVVTNQEAINKIVAYQVIQDYLMKCALKPSLFTPTPTWNIAAYEPDKDKRGTIKSIIDEIVGVSGALEAEEGDEDEDEEEEAAAPNTFLRDRFEAIQAQMKSKFLEVFREEGLASILDKDLYEQVIKDPLLINDSLKKILQYMTPSAYTALLSKAIERATNAANSAFEDVNVSSIIEEYGEKKKQEYLFRETKEGVLNGEVVIMLNDPTCTPIDFDALDKWTPAEKVTNALLWSLLKPLHATEPAGKLRSTIQQFQKNGERVCVESVDGAGQTVKRERNYGRITNVDDSVFLLNLHYNKNLKGSLARGFDIKNSLDPADSESINALMRESLEITTFLYLNSSNKLDIVRGIKSAGALNRFKPSVLQYLQDLEKQLDEAKIAAKIKSNPEEMETIGRFAQQQVQIQQNRLFLYYSAMTNFATIPTISDILNINEIPHVKDEVEQIAAAVQEVAASAEKTIVGTSIIGPKKIDMWAEFNRIAAFSSPLKYDETLLPAENLKNLLSKVQQGDNNYAKTKHLLRIIIGMYTPPITVGDAQSLGGLRADYNTFYEANKLIFETNNELSDISLNSLSTTLLARLNADVPGAVPLLVNNPQQAAGLRNVYEFMRRLDTMCSNAEMHMWNQDTTWRDDNFMGMFPLVKGYLEPRDIEIKSELSNAIQDYIKREISAAISKQAKPNEATWKAHKDDFCEKISKSLKARIAEIIKVKGDNLDLFNKKAEQIIKIQRIFEETGTPPSDEDIRKMGIMDVDALQYLELCKKFATNKPLLLHHIGILLNSDNTATNANTVFTTSLPPTSQPSVPLAAAPPPPAPANAPRSAGALPAERQSAPGAAQKSTIKQGLSQNEALKLNEILSERIDVAESLVTPERSVLQETLSFLYSFMNSILNGLGGFGAPSHNSGSSGLDGPGQTTLVEPTVVTDTDDARGATLCRRHKDDYQIIGGNYRWTSTTVVEPENFPRGACIKPSITAIYLEYILEYIVFGIETTIEVICNRIFPSFGSGSRPSGAPGPAGAPGPRPSGPRPSGGRRTWTGRGISLSVCGQITNVIMDQLDNLTTKLTEEFATDINRMRDAVGLNLSEPFDPEVYFRLETYIDKDGNSVAFTQEQKLNDLAIYYNAGACMAMGGDIKYTKLSQALNGNSKIIYNYGKFKMDGISESLQSGLNVAKLFMDGGSIAIALKEFLIAVFTWGEARQKFNKIIEALTILIVGDMSIPDLDPRSTPTFGESPLDPTVSINPFQSARKILQKLAKPADPTKTASRQDILLLQTSLVDKMATKIRNNYASAFGNLFASSTRPSTLNVTATVDNTETVTITDWETRNYMIYHNTYKDLRDDLLSQTTIDTGKYVDYGIKIDGIQMPIDQQISDDICKRIQDKRSTVTIEPLVRIAELTDEQREVELSSAFFHKLNGFLKPQLDPISNIDLDLFKERTILGAKWNDKDLEVKLNGLSITNNFFLSSYAGSLSEKEVANLPALIKSLLSQIITNSIYFEGIYCADQTARKVEILEDPEVHSVTVPFHIREDCLPPILQVDVLEDAAPSTKSTISTYYTALPDTPDTYYLNADKKQAMDMGLNDEQFIKIIKDLIPLDDDKSWWSWKSKTTSQHIKQMAQFEADKTTEKYINDYKPITDQNILNWTMIFTSASAHPTMTYLDPGDSDAASIKIITDNQPTNNFDYNKYLDPKKFPPILLDGASGAPAYIAGRDSHYRGPIDVDGKQYYYLKDIPETAESDIKNIIINSETADLAVISGYFRKFKLKISHARAPAYRVIVSRTTGGALAEWGEGTARTLTDTALWAGGKAREAASTTIAGAQIAASAAGTGLAAAGSGIASVGIAIKDAATSEPVQTALATVGSDIAAAGYWIVSFFTGGSSQQQQQIAAAVDPSSDGEMPAAIVANNITRLFNSTSTGKVLTAASEEEIIDAIYPFINTEDTDTESLIERLLDEDAAGSDVTLSEASQDLPVATPTLASSANGSAFIEEAYKYAQSRGAFSEEQAVAEVGANGSITIPGLSSIARNFLVSKGTLPALTLPSQAAETPAPATATPSATPSAAPSQSAETPAPETATPSAAPAPPSATPSASPSQAAETPAPAAATPSASPSQAASATPSLSQIAASDIPIPSAATLLPEIAMPSLSSPAATAAPSQTANTYPISAAAEASSIAVRKNIPAESVENTCLITEDNLEEKMDIILRTLFKHVFEKYENDKGIVHRKNLEISEQIKLAERAIWKQLPSSSHQSKFATTIQAEKDLSSLRTKKYIEFERINAQINSTKKITQKNLTQLREQFLLKGADKCKILPQIQQACSNYKLEENILLEQIQQVLSSSLEEVSRIIQTLNLLTVS